MHQDNRLGLRLEGVLIQGLDTDVTSRRATSSVLPMKVASFRSVQRTVLTQQTAGPLTAAAAAA